MTLRELAKKAVISCQVRVHVIGRIKWQLYRLVRTLLRIPHQAELHGLSKLGLGDATLFLDVGGNLGQTIDTVRLYSASTPIMTFEPNPLLADTMRILFKKDKHVTVHDCGLGSQVGVTEFHVPCYNGYAFPELASLRAESAESWYFRKYIWMYDPSDFSIIKQEWHVRCLDDFAVKPYIIKVDAQGMEIEIVRGALATIENCRPIILLKGVCYDGRLREMLEPFGYRMYAYKNGRFVLTNELIWNAYFFTEKVK